tara:strand:- start:461 stop:730 length:270 start_codon:yes stop_codon:yes gene_type:complete
MSYTILPYTYRQAKKYGLQVKSSQRSNYKIDIFNSKGEYLFSGGDRRFSDYPHYIKTHGKEYADERRRLYRIRHVKETVRGRLISALLW